MPQFLSDPPIRPSGPPKSENSNGPTQVPTAPCVQHTQNCLHFSMCHLGWINLLVITFLVGLTTNSCILANAAPLVLYEDSQFRGTRTEYLLEGSNCLNIRGKLNDVFSSVQQTDAQACFLLCEHEYCRGRCVMVTSSIEDFNDMEFNDMVSSVKLCPPNTLTDTNTTTSTSTTSTPSPPSSRSVREVKDAADEGSSSNHFKKQHAIPNSSNSDKDIKITEVQSYASILLEKIVRILPSSQVAPGAESTST